eukprot:TRINITY_DN8867_c0_g1_i1.p1 TRINITY_DN8867_c0_g1~~TRINITY_DN8867_c0_g1_i1.p1  ORF type:complete len:414 (-),score=111.24 TRINITY_DN8867_c0_g1_i1:221-1414(-)
MTECKVPLATRLQRLGTETAFDVLVRAKKLEAKGKHIVHLEIGEPAFDTPQHIIDEAVRSLKSHGTHYTPATGMPHVRKAVANFINQTRGVTIDPENVVVMPGAKPVIFYTMLALIEKGDEVIYENPGFPIYESMINFCGGKAVPLQLREELRWRFDVDELRKLVTKRTKLIVINSPHNPTGGILTKKELEAIAKIAIENDIMVLSDEIYDQISYDGEHASIISIPGMLERTIMLHGHSKNYAMTGWRLGYGIFPSKLTPYISKLSTNCHSCVAQFTQDAGAIALSSSQDTTKEMVEEYKRRRDLVVKELNAMGLKTLSPEGAFYVFANVQNSGMNSRALADYFLEESGVAVLDGACFGKFGSGYIRLSYVNSVANLKEGLKRMRKGLKRLKQKSKL